MQQLNRKSTTQVEKFLKGFKDTSVKGTTFDSVGSQAFVKEETSRSESVIPESLQVVLDSVAGETDGQARVLNAVNDAMLTYKNNHGRDLPPDVLEQALHNAYSLTPDGLKAVYDSVGTSMQSTQAYQSDRAIVAILAMTNTAIPFAHYLPADIRSNQAKLAILEHTAGTETGIYKDGNILDGAHSGGRYISSARDHLLESDGSGNWTGKITKVQLDDDTCAQDAESVKLKRGSLLIYVDGCKSANEMTSGSTVAPVAGSTVIDGTTHSISGTVNNDTGEISLVINPELPTGSKVLAEGFIDYENQPELTPLLLTTVRTFDLFANSWRALTRQTIDSRTQMQNELGLDSYNEGVYAIQNQFSSERHYDVLRKAKRLASRNTASFAFEWGEQGNFKKRADIWQDFSAILGSVSQKMALLTMAYGVSHLYVGEKVGAQLQGLPSEIWQSSGITSKAGIYRLGRLFGIYDVYYTPKGVVEGEESAEILCIGQAPDVTRNPFILGDAVAPTVIPLATNSDLNTGAGYYARNFTSVNPHEPSAMGCALITVTNLF